MLLDLVLVAALAAFAAAGAWRGPAETGLRLAGWIAGYGAAWLAATRLGPAVADALGVAPLVGLPLAGMGGFVAMQALVHVAVVLLRRDAEPPGPAGRVLGALLGAARGGVVVVLLGWLALLAEGMRAQGVAGLPATGDSAVGRASGLVVERAATALAGERPEARAVAALVGRPAESIAAWRDVLAHPRVVALQSDPAFWHALEVGDAAAARARPSFRALAGDASLREELGRLGVVSPGAAINPGAFARELEAALTEAAARVAALRDDPEVEAFLADPEVRALLQRGDALRLLAHPGFQSLLRRASAS